MMNLTEGTVAKILEQSDAMSVVLVQLAQGEFPAICYHRFTGTPQAGDRVVVNTTAMDLGLGSGGFHFVVYNQSRPFWGRQEGPGHIMKLRYTPWQFRVLSVEEEKSPHRQIMEEAASLEGMPVVVTLLHSHLTPAALALHWASQGQLRIVYIMTDGGALPLPFSRQATELKEKRIIAATITAGHAFGGDLEAVNYFSALLAAKHALRADAAIIGMGPGHVGTNTPFGFSGLEQGQIVNAVAALDGKPVVAPRISFADPRPRHRGLSHHSQTILKTVVLTTAWVALPRLPREQAQLVWQQIKKERLEDKFHFIEKDAAPLREVMGRYAFDLSSMGRSYDEDPAFFDAAWAAGLVAHDLHLAGHSK